jgi:hypothetical protein
MTDLAKILIDNKNKLLKALEQGLNSKEFRNYKTAWWEIEQPAVQILVEEIQKLVSEKASFIPATDKNTYPDLEIKTEKGSYAIDVKSVRYIKERASRNDLGTINSFAEKKKTFKQQFFLFIRYIEIPEKKDVYTVKDFFLDPYWRDVGRRSDGISVEYREKDGNLRPKSWIMFEKGESFYNTEAEFLKAFDNAVKLRAKNIINKHLGFLDDENLRTLSDKLQNLLEERKEGKVKRKTYLDIEEDLPEVD